MNHSVELFIYLMVKGGGGGWNKIPLGKKYFIASIQNEKVCELHGNLLLWRVNWKENEGH